MKNFDTRVQMMDAGMKLFETENGFGTCIGQVKANLKEYGKVLESKDLTGIALPGSTGDCDLFADRTNLWRKKYISCKVEYAGEREEDGKIIYRYASSFKEGNKSTVLRGMTMIVLMLLSVTGAIWFNSFLSYTAGIVIILVTAYFWIMPSSEAVRTVRKIMDEL
ncbi:MAG: hypothetical protein ACI3ZP_10640 [Candidatus Cryptobacteroides sp.]